ncbi:hypothetical protein LINGRAHAP2_LOCUS17723, partial [Linum grandiflorum]
CILDTKKQNEKIVIILQFISCSAAANISIKDRTFSSPLFPPLHHRVTEYMALQISGIAAGVLRIHQHTKHGVALARPSFSFTTRSTSTHVVGFRNRMPNALMATPSDSNPNTTRTSGGEEKLKQKQPTSTTGVGNEGPPLATILAGFVVFFGFCWVLFTIGSWLFNLIVTPPPLK